MISRYLSCAAAVVLISCGGGSGGGSSPAPVDQTTTVIVPTFTDITRSAGIDYRHGYLLPVGSETEAFGGGVAAGDYDADGDVDLFVVRGDIGPNLLFRNLGDNTFIDVAAAAGLAFTKSGTENYRHSGPTFADLDGDGDLDLFIGGIEGDRSFIYANNGNGTFTDVTAGSGIDRMNAEQTISAAFGDYDRDGDLDMFLSHWGTPRNVADPGDTEHLWQNISAGGAIRFVSVSVAAGISATVFAQVRGGMGVDFDYTFTPTFSDIDGDGYVDILSVADFASTRVYMNNRDGTFTDVTDPDVIIDESGMGSAVGDYDNDGDMDWFVTAIADSLQGQDVGNRLYRNSNGVFEDVTVEAGVKNGRWGWAACFADFNADGALDIYHTNGWENQVPGTEFAVDPSRLFMSNGDGTFFDRAQSSGILDLAQGRGVVCADFDNDGDIDVFVTHRTAGGGAYLYRNDTTGNNYVSIELIGSGKNTEAAGARVSVTVGGLRQTREIRVGNNFTSQNPTRQVFGLGSASQVDTIAIVWPDGSVESDENVRSNQVIVYEQSP